MTFEADAPGVSAVEAPSQPAAQSTPQPVELKDDAVVSIPGVNKPVKWGEWYRDYQGRFTKATQSAAELARKQQELEQRASQAEQRAREYENALRQRAREAQQTGSRNDLINSIKSLQYLSGEDAAAVVQNLLEQINGVGGQFQQRDVALVALYNKLLEQQKYIDEIRGRSAEQSFDQLVSSTLKELGIPDEASDWAKEIYLAYEGDDLRSEFPRILGERWEQIQRFVRANDRKAADASRNRPFVPGKGGNGVPGAPLNLRQGASPAEMAEALFPMLGAGDNT